MTAQTTGVYSGELRPDSSDEIDLRRYLLVLLKWWREIVISTAVTALIGAALATSVKALTPPVYETSADVIMARVVSSVNLVDNFQTTTEGMNQIANANARRETLVHLVKSGAIAEAVIAELGNLLNENERQPATLLGMVKSEAPVGSDSRMISDLIRITVKAETPQKAEAIANSWTRHYIAHVNSVYNQVPVEIFDSVQTELQKAQNDYTVAQKALETFIATSRIDELQYQIDQKVALRTNYLDAQKLLINTVVDMDRAARVKMFTDLASTQTDAVYQVFTQQVREKIHNLEQLYTQRDLTQRQLTQAQNLSQQIKEGADAQAAGTELALQLLKTQIYATIEGSSLPGGLSIDLSTLLTDENADPQADVATLINTLTNYVSQLDDGIATLSEQLLRGEGYSFINSYTPENLIISSVTATETMTTLAGTQNELASAIYERYFDLFGVSELAQLGETESGIQGSSDMALIITNLNHEIQTLQADLAAEQAKQLFITQQRDLMLTTYNTLNNKVVELTLARTAANTEVRLGSPAIAPNAPVDSVSLLMITVIAAMLGLLLALFAVTIANFMGWHTWLGKNHSAPTSAPTSAST